MSPSVRDHINELAASSNRLANNAPITIQIQSPVIVLRCPELNVQQSNFLVDTGSSLNILKQRVLKKEVDVNIDKSFKIAGIGEGKLETLGWVNITLHDVECRVFLVSDEINIEHDGILGVEFLRTRNGVISVSDGLLTLNKPVLERIRFVNRTAFQRRNN